MLVFKFGGASVKDAEGIRRLSAIVQQYPSPNVIVVSAMGKTTNALEEIFDLAYHEKDYYPALQKVRLGHQEIARDLFPLAGHPVHGKLHHLFEQLAGQLERPKTRDYDMEYDQVVPFGELLSTTLVSQYLQEIGQENLWLDARQLIATDDSFRDAGIDWHATRMNIQKKIKPGHYPLCVIQGFIGGTHGGLATTLGREGSDYSGAILANILEAKSLTIWKDVPGVLTADPKVYPGAKLFPAISYEEAIELAFYGAKVIHPKTLKPLQNKQIPLFVKSFMEPGAPGTQVGQVAAEAPFLPVIIQKENQALLTISPADLSFAIEFMMEKIFALLFRHRLKARLIQVSAIRFSVCIDNHPAKLSCLLGDIGEEFLVELKKDVCLVTIRHFRQEVIDRLIVPQKILIEQRNQENVHFVMGR